MKIMRFSRILPLCGGILLAQVSASASTVSSTVGSPDSDGNVTTTITVTPGAGESIRDFHLRPVTSGAKVPKKDTGFGSSAGWNTNDNTAWRSWGSGSSSSSTTSAPMTFTIVVPEDHSTYGTFKWRTTNTGKTGAVPGSSSSDVEDTGQELPPNLIPIASATLTGPGTVRLGEAVIFAADNPILVTETLNYTISFSRSIDPLDPSRINAQDMVPESLGFGLSTNSRTGTTTPAEGIRSATYFGDMRNHVILDVPDDTSLLGLTFYLQAEWSDGMLSPPTPVTFIGN